MNRKTHALTLSALLSALTVATIYIAALFPTLELTVMALASIFTACAVIESGVGTGLSVFLVSSTLGALILPNKAAILTYVMFFGYYPIIKSFAERCGSRLIEWVIKLGVFTAALTVMWVFFSELIFGLGEVNILIVYIAGNALLALFDYGFTKLIWLYIYRISKNIKRK